MRIYETPKEVASTLARWAPRHISCLLDPSVGTGALVRPLVSRLRGNRSRIYCIDINQDALATVDRKYRRYFGPSMTLLNSDFLNVRFEASFGESPPFDCIVMNPPFAAKRQHLRKVNLDSDRNTKDLICRKSSLEGAFLVRAVQLLKPGGRILAILPSSVVSGNTSQWIREFLLASGSIRCVHELPHFTFERVEARIYLLVFEKSASTKRIILRNHKLVCPDELLLTKYSIGKDNRLDYCFQASRLWFAMLQSATPEAEWSSLKDHADLSRGQADSPDGIEIALHTTDYKNGFWRLTRLNNSRLANRKGSGLRHTDLLVTRVGRRSTDSIGAVVGSAPLDFTDCVIRIRPKNRRSHTRLLFALRCLLVCEEGRSLVQRGSSAKYIVQSDFESLYIPWNLVSIYPKAFAKYKSAVHRHQFLRMQQLERYVRSMLKIRLENRS